MSLLRKLLRREPRHKEAQPRSFGEFLGEAEKEIDDLIREAPRWFSELPYGGAMTKEQARDIEIEKRAVWRRVIYDAKRSKLPALRWETSRDEKVCGACAQLDGRLFGIEEYDDLNAIRMHVGCRCNLVPSR